MSWKIVSFDRAQGRGRITSGLGTLEFDAAVALTDDFRVGEEVAVQLRREGESYVVTRIEPVAWHAPAAPDRVVTLAPEIADAVNGRTLAVRGLDEDATLTVVIVPESYEPERRLLFEGCVFFQVAPEMTDVATITAFTAADFTRDAADLARHWPALPPTAIVFRIDPLRFGDTAGYVVAMKCRGVLQSSPA